MNNETYKLPPRKWYTFTQASQKLTQELNKLVTVDDIIHFLFLGTFLPYISVKYEINNKIEFNNKYSVDLTDKNNEFIENNYSVEEFNYSDIRMLSDYCNLALQHINYPKDYTTKWLIPFGINLVNKIESEFGKLSSDNRIGILEKFFLKYKKLTYGIDGLLAIKIECLYNGNPSMSDEMEMCNNGLKIKEQDFITPRMFELDKMAIFTLKVKEPFYIAAEDLIIVYDDLLRIKNGFRANLRGFAEYADEMGRLPSNIPAYFLEWDKKEMPEQKTIEKTDLSMVKPNEKTPRQYSKEYYRKIVIDSCIATFQHYPTAGKNTLVKAVLKELIANHGIRKVDLQSERTYTNILEQTKIEFPNEKGKTIEISKVIIVKP